MGAIRPQIVGDRPKTCIIHCRVSTARQKYQGESLDVQASICMEIQTARGWALVCPPWKEGFSGRKEIRPVFEEILAYLDAHPGEVGYYLFRSIDRFTRGGTLMYEQMKREIMKRGVEMVDSMGIIQPSRNTLEHYGFEYSWSRVYPSAISEAVVASAAQAEVSTILTRLVGEQIRLTQLGYKIGRPHDGYENAKVFVHGKKHTIEKPHPERARYIIELFKLRASGMHSDQQICDHLNAMGYRTEVKRRWSGDKTEVIGNSGGGLMTTKRLQKIVRLPIYCGVICGKWTKGKPVKASYPGLVSVELFNMANRGKVFVRETESGLELLYDYKPELQVSKRSRNNPLFSYRHVVLCPLCSKPFLGSLSRGKSGKRFAFYHCARSHKYFGVSKGTFEKTVQDFLNALRFRPEAAYATRTMFLMGYEERCRQIVAAEVRMKATIAELEVREASILRAFPYASTDLMRSSLEEQALAVRQEIENARAMKMAPVSAEEFDRFMNDFQKIIEHPACLLENPDNPTQSRARFDFVFAIMPTYTDFVNRTPNLRPFFWLSSSLYEPKSSIVRNRSPGWNTIEQEFLHWKKLSPLLGFDEHEEQARYKRAA